MAYPKKKDKKIKMFNEKEKKKWQKKQPNQVYHKFITMPLSADVELREKIFCLTGKRSYLFIVIS